MESNQQQVAGWLRAALAAGGPISALVLSKTGISSEDWALYTEAALAIVPPLAVAIWSWYSSRKTTQIKSVQATPGVQVHVDPVVAAPAVVAMSESQDPSLKDVVPMHGGPREDKATGDPPPADAETVKA